jgi:LysR family transcriptional regulator, regulatory protein for tcuABC
MELRQLRYFVRVVELGSLGRAAADLGVVTSTLSQQISRLETELSTRLLQRTSQGVVPTDAGLAFWRQAQLALRHADEARRAAQQGRLSGTVSVGLAPTTAAVLAAPFMAAMRARYPQIHLHLVESLSGHLGDMLSSRQLDLAMLFVAETATGLDARPLLDEHLFVIGATDLAGMPKGRQVRLARLGPLPLLMPSAPHGLRAIVDAAFARARCQPHVIAEIDGLAILMEQVRAGVAATIQPGAAVSRRGDAGLRLVRVVDAGAKRRNVLASLSEDELSPAALAARIVLVEVVRQLVIDQEWIGATLHES